MRVPRQESSAAVRVFQVLTLATLAMAALLALIPAAGHDQLWFLLMAQRWLAGARLYGPEAFDSNTPAIVWLSAIPVALARHLDLAAPAAAKLCVVLLEAAVAALCLRLLPQGVRRSRQARPQRWFLAAVFVAIFAVVPARDFGQRDHLTTLLLLPYLLALTAPSRNTRFFTAALAAAGICLKPQLALIPLAVELYLIRKRRSEPLIFLTIGAAFLLAIHLFAGLYFTAALPTTRATYWAVGHLTLWQLFLESPQLSLLALITLTLHLTRKPSVPSPFSALPLLLAATAATLAYYLQGTGWYYQQLPAISLFALTLAAQVLPLKLPTPTWLPLAATALTALAIALTFHFSGYSFTPHPFTPDTTYAIESPDPAFFRDLPPGTSIATLTTSVEDAIMPVFRYNLVWAQRTDNLWTLPAILRATRLSPEQRETLAAQQRRWMVEDLTRWRPQLILAARCQDPTVHCQTLEDRHDNLLAFFMQDPAFAQLFTHYHFLASKGKYDAYTLTEPLQHR